MQSNRGEVSPLQLEQQTSVLRRIGVLTLAVLLILSGRAEAHDVDLTPAEAAAVRRCIAALGTLASEEQVPGRGACAVLEALGEIGSSKLSHFSHLPLGICSEAERGQLLRAARAALVWRGVYERRGSRCRQAWNAASESSQDFEAACLEEVRAGVGADLSRFVAFFAADARPAVRGVVGAVAGVLELHGAPSESQAKLAQNLLLDRTPEVAETVARVYSSNFESEAYLAGLVSLLDTSDERSEVVSGPLAGSKGRVADSAFLAVSSHWLLLREMGDKNRNLPDGFGIEDVRKWWRGRSRPDVRPVSMNAWRQVGSIRGVAQPGKWLVGSGSAAAYRVRLLSAQLGGNAGFAPCDYEFEVADVPPEDGLVLGTQVRGLECGAVCALAGGSTTQTLVLEMSVVPSSEDAWRIALRIWSR